MASSAPPTSATCAPASSPAARRAGPGIPERDEPFVLTAIDLARPITATLDPTR